MSDLSHKQETEVYLDGGIYKSITNVSNEVFIDTKALNGTYKLYSDYFKDSEEFIVISKDETFRFDVELNKDSYYYEDYRHIDNSNQFIKISILSDGVYKTIFNFEKASEYKKLQSYITRSEEFKDGIYYISFEFKGVNDILEALGKTYVYDTNEIKIEIADKSGHIFTCTNQIPIYCFPFDLDNILPLEITFERQNPSQRYIGDNSIGSVYAIIHNPDNDGEKPSADYLPINVYLGEESVGSIVNHEIVYFYYNEYGERVYVKDNSEIAEYRESSGYTDLNRYEWLQVKIDNIVQTGYVQLYAYLGNNAEFIKSITNTKALNYIEERIYKSSFAYGTDGEWIAECPNNKKINLEPFVPMYLKDSQYFDFVKFTEDFLNTMFYSNEANCKVGVLKKIHDLRTLHDIDELDRRFFNDFAKHFGSTIKIDEENLVKILTIFGDKSKVTYDEEDLVKYIREAYRILPYYNKIKGTDESIKLILSTFGCSCEIIYKWLSKLDGNNELYENVEDKVDKDSYYLSSHFNIDLGIKNYKIEEYIDIIKPVRELVFSIKPITRVFDAFEYSLETSEILTIDLGKSILNVNDRICDNSTSDNRLYEPYYDEEGNELYDYKVDIRVQRYSNSNMVNLYEITFYDNMTTIGLDNFEKFISNNGKKLIIYDDDNPIEIEYSYITFVDGKLYIKSSTLYDFSSNVCKIVCKLLKNSRTFILK